ncbi:MAG: cupin domain-containing protein [Oligoflexus sp.]|nr:cupin domain-containing protein [Oligoflexus sp.]
MNQKNAIIKRFGMVHHPEGGAFVETYRSSLLVANQEANERVASTGILFLLGRDEFSAFHRIKSDEMWHFYSGDSLRIIEISPAGDLKETRLGINFIEGELCQYVVPAGAWFASIPVMDGVHGFSFVGCTVAPGFDFSDFELADEDELTQAFPQHRATIHSLIHASRL